MDIRYAGLLAIVILAITGAAAIVIQPEVAATLLPFLATLVSATLSLVVLAKVQETHDSVNGKMEKLLKVTGDAEYAKGVKAEKEGTS